jgi:fibro-slime domain-containing protein
MNVLGRLLSITLFAVTIPVWGATLTLSGTVRDFKGENEAGGHTDFETAYDGLDLNAVQPVLGSDGRPVFNAAGAGLAFSNAANFNQWWNPSAFSMAAPLSITLDDTGHPGKFTYSNTSFFPIDGQLYGNTPGWSHNFHFTYEIHTTFNFQAGQTFNFTGDDDVWVFLNGQRAVDLGGIHSAASVALTLAEGQFGMTSGNNYSFDFFFAERHTSASNLLLETTLALQPNEVPEPSTWAMLAGGLAMLAAGWRRRR